MVGSYPATIVTPNFYVPEPDAHGRLPLLWADGRADGCAFAAHDPGGRTKREDGIYITGPYIMVRRQLALNVDEVIPLEPHNFYRGCEGPRLMVVMARSRMH